jgi:hypothetical protein
LVIVLILTLVSFILQVWWSIGQVARAILVVNGGNRTHEGRNVDGARSLVNRYHGDLLNFGRTRTGVFRISIPGVILMGEIVRVGIPLILHENTTNSTGDDE